MLKYPLIIIIGLSSLMSSAQLHVRDEPRHHNVFENEYIRVLDVHLGPKDTTLYHLHNTPSVFIVLTNTIVSSQHLGGKPQKGANLTGNIDYDSMATPRNHRVWNEDTGWFHVMDIELTAKNSFRDVAILKNDGLSLLFNEREVNGYKAELKPKKILGLPPADKGYLLICLSHASLDYKTYEITEHRLMKPGHYLWIDAAKNAFLSITGQVPASFVLLQLK